MDPTHPSCPWSHLQPATIEFCERRLCGWITEPANTWSNIGYLIVGLIVIWKARKERYPILATIGWIEVVLFFGSSAFHATSTFLAELADLFSMFLFANFAMCFNLWRLFAWPKLQLVGLFIGMSLGGVVAMLIHNPIGIQAFTAMIVVTGVLEIIMAYRRHHVDYRYLRHLCLAFSLSYGIWNLDIHKIICNPDNHILQGHSLWHLINSTCFLFLYLFYRQFLPKGSST